MQGQCRDEERQEYMESGRTIPKDIDEYIRLFPDDIQALLQSLRQTIREAAPDAEETISYQMPAFKQNGMLVYFAAFKKHIGFYPTSSGIEAFREELSAYEGSKGTVRFPIDKPLPLDLVRDIVKFRVQETLEKQRKKR
jgi:uncharacterized protein YdhG (YjbR/CyaY superfamily)